MRFLRLLNAEAQLHVQGSLWYAASIMVFWLLTPLHSPYFFILYLGGMLLASNSFNDMHDPTQAYRALTLPCSNLEKWISKWLISSFGFAIALLGLYYLTALISMLLPLGLFGLGKDFPLPSLERLGEAMLVFLPFNAIALLGATYFKRFVLLKTGLITAVIGFTLTNIVLQFGLQLLFPVLQHQEWFQANPNPLLITLAVTAWTLFLLTMYSLSFYLYKNTEIG